VKDTFTTKGFADHFIDQRGHTNTFLDKIDALIDWKNIEKVFSKKYKKGPSADGRPPYPALPMFKLLLLQRWYGLSDPGLEEAVKDRISFIRFSGFSISSALPDHSTICRFRNALLDLNLFEKLFTGINRQLETKGILVRESNGAILDATIVESSRRPRKVIEVMPEDRKEEEYEDPVSPTVVYSDDPDARWLKKGKRTYYGYKAHIAVESKDGFILGGHITPANVADITEFEKLLEESHLSKDTPVFADKGYSSAKNREILEGRGYIDGIMQKAVRGKPLTFFQRLVNRFISSVRYKVEQGIGTLKRGYRLFRMRYLGVTKGNMELMLTGMAFNLKKAVLMME
jgi:IS5 family transposase